MRRVVASIALLMAAGCLAPPVTERDLTSPEASRRALAVRQAAERRDQSLIPAIVDRLEDEDESVRFYAILALERLTGDRMGYEYHKSPGQQVEAVNRWRRYAQGGAAASRPAYAVDRPDTQEPPGAHP